MADSALHLVLGAGQVGPLIARHLTERGLRVRVGRRSAAPARVPDVETVSLDVRDPVAVASAAKGGSVVYHCANPLYTEWNELLLPMTRGIVEGTARAGARLVVLDNLYMYGDTACMNEQLAPAPRSRKGALRERAANLMLEADARGDLPVAIGRAADFFGPGAALGAVFGEQFWKRVLAGKSAQVLGDPDMPHAYSYTPDVAAGLVALGLDDAARGVSMLPVLPAETTRQVIARVGQALGAEIAISQIPTWVVRAMGLFSPLMREVAEMVYQWTQPFAVDDAAFRARYRLAPTPWDVAMAATVAWARTV